MRLPPFCKTAAFSFVTVPENWEYIICAERDKDMELLSEELELGKGIEAYIQTEILTNFAMENYYAKTNREFFKTIFDTAYPNLEKQVSDLKYDTADDVDIATKHLAFMRYERWLDAVMSKSLKQFIDACEKIITKQRISLEAEKWFRENVAENLSKGQSRSKSIETAVRGLIEEIRKQEEAMCANLEPKEI